MKILVLTNLYPPNHAGTYDFRCQSLTDGLRLRGHTMRVLTSIHGTNQEQRGGEVERRLLLNGVYEHPAVTGYGELRRLEIQNHLVLRETIEQFAPDVIHVFSLKGLSKSLIFGLRQSRRPTVYDVADDWLAAGVREDPWLRWWNRPGGPALQTAHRTLLETSGQRNALDESAPTRMMKGFERVPLVYGDADTLAAVPPNSVTAFRFDRVYFCSQALKTLTEHAGFRVNHGEVIYPGIPTNLFVGDLKPASAPVQKFLVVGRLDERSGAVTAVRALEILRANNLPATLGIHGRGTSDFIAGLRSYVSMHKLPVDFASAPTAAKEWLAIYRKHDALLHASEWNEPFAVAPLEAMACGLPVIGTTLGGAGELFRHGENALTYPAGDAAALAGRMQELQALPDLRCQIADNAQQEVLSKFNETAVMDRIENYLETSCESWQHAAG